MFQTLFNSVDYVLKFNIQLNLSFLYWKKKKSSFEIKNTNFFKNEKKNDFAGFFPVPFIWFKFFKFLASFRVMIK